jgi:hypothetical protein
MSGWLGGLGGLPCLSLGSESVLGLIVSGVVVSWGAVWSPRVSCAHSSTLPSPKRGIAKPWWWFSFKVPPENIP